MRRCMARHFTVAAMAVLATACTPASPPFSDTAASREPHDNTVPAAELRDTTIALTEAGTNGWNYQQRADADLDGDGRSERVVMTAQVEVYRGLPAWDDGQAWQVYVEKGDSVRTQVYAKRLQLGTLAMRVTRPDSGTAATIVLIEHLPDRLSVYEVAMDSASAPTVTLHLRRLLDPRGETASVIR